MSISTPADRVKRYRDYLAEPFGRDTDAQRAAYEAGVGAATANALEAIETDAAPEAATWATLASVISFRFRKAI